MAGSIGYKIRYKVSGTSVWTNKSSAITSITINGLSPGTNYIWQLKNLCSSNPGISSDWSGKQKFITGSLRTGEELFQQIYFQIFPNPATDHATVQFTITQSSHVYIKVYDVSGKEKETLLNDNLEPGEHTLLINTNHFSKGVYLVKMNSDSGVETQKLIVQ